MKVLGFGNDFCLLHPGALRQPSLGSLRYKLRDWENLKESRWFHQECNSVNPELFLLHFILSMKISRSGTGLPLDSAPCVDSGLNFCPSHPLRLSNLRFWFSGISKYPQIKSVSVLCSPLWFLPPPFLLLANPYCSFISSMIDNILKYSFQLLSFFNRTLYCLWELVGDRCFESCSTTPETHCHWLKDLLIG